MQLVKEPAAAERITRAIDDLDTSIRHVRSTIFQLNQRWSATRSLRSEIVAICDESSEALGFTPSCDITGPIDSAVGEPALGHLLLCLARRFRTSPGMPGQPRPRRGGSTPASSP